MAKKFKWSANHPLPAIEDHTKRKLEVLEQYLQVYFDTVVNTPAMDRLNITLVDGFAGGGAYQDGEDIRNGSPLVFIQAVEEAEKRINANRTKPVVLNAKYFFVDNRPDHIESLKKVLVDSGYWERNKDRISIREGDFVDSLPEILSHINETQRVGRSIFLLDQCGYSDVPMASITKIFSSLDRAEIILTFAIDALLNYLNTNHSGQQLYEQFGVDKRFIEAWEVQKHDENLGRLIAQRTLMSKILNYSDAKFFTPFMLWSRTDNRWMMFAHLSQHQAARDKMLGVHWGIQNCFTHFGRGSLFNLGFDARLLESRDSLFKFSDNDRIELGKELLVDVPSELRKAMIEDQIPVQTFLETIGNRTAATNKDIFSVLELLSQEKELVTVSSNGKIKRAGAKIAISDRLELPQQPTLFLPKGFN